VVVIDRIVGCQDYSESFQRIFCWSALLTLPCELILTCGGRFGWFMSSSVVREQWNTSHSIIDHWRALQRADVSSIFDLRNVPQYLTRPDRSSTVTYCDELSNNCRNGFYHSQQCRQHANNCAVLLSSYPGTHVYGDLSSIKTTYFQFVACVFRLHCLHTVHRCGLLLQMLYVAWSRRVLCHMTLTLGLFTAK